MRVTVKLHGILRDHLPREAKGKTTLTLVDDATVAHVRAHLGIDRRCVTLVNDEEIEDGTRLLQDGDDVQMLMVLGGGLLMQ